MFRCLKIVSDDFLLILPLIISKNSLDYQAVERTLGVRLIVGFNRALLDKSDFVGEANPVDRLEIDNEESAQPGFLHTCFNSSC